MNEKKRIENERNLKIGLKMEKVEEFIK